jgi:hypothetical protein
MSVGKIQMLEGLVSTHCLFKAVGSIFYGFYFEKCLSDHETRELESELNTISIDWNSDDDGEYDEFNPVFKRRAIRNSGFGDDGFSVEITRIPKNADLNETFESKVKHQRFFKLL